MTKPVYRLIVIAILQLFIIFVLSLFLVFSSGPNKKSWNDEISSLDRLINNNYMDLAEKSIKRLTRQAETRLEWLQLLKRNYLLGKNDNDYSSFMQLCTMAIRYYPSDKDIRAFYINSLLLTDNEKKAVRQKNKIVGREYATLKAELNLVEYFIENNNQKNKGNYYESLTKQLALSKDPEFFLQMGNMLDIPELIFDSAILYKRNGQDTKALNIISEINTDNISPESLAYFFYDSEENEKAVKYFEIQYQNDQRFHNQKWILNHLLGDLLFHTDKEKSAFYYENAINTEPEGNNSWISYLNLSNCYYLQGQLKKSYYLLDKALGLYPQNKKIIAAYVARNKFEKPVYTEKLLNDYNNQFQDPEIDLILLTQYNQQDTSASFQAKLWNLYNNNPENRIICEYILWYLIGINDREGIEVVLERYNKSNPESGWPVFYEAIMYTLKNDYKKAGQLMAEYINQYPDSWTACYNQGIILNLDKTRLEEALPLFLQAEKIVENKQYEKNDIILSNIHFQEASILYQLNQVEESLAELENSLQYNPDNIRSLHLGNLIKQEIN